MPNLCLLPVIGKFSPEEFEGNMLFHSRDKKGGLSIPARSPFGKGGSGRDLPEKSAELQGNVQGQ
jgi:hypothetical protein